MPNPNEIELTRAVDRLRNANDLRRRGVDAVWIAQCQRLAEQAKQLNARFRELESQLCDPVRAVTDDTMLM